jgi:hypothetical protein
MALGLILGGVGALLLSRSRVGPDVDDAGEEPPDVRAAGVASEAVVLMALVWIVFQAYAAWALVQMWTVSRAGLGSWYDYLEIGGAMLTVAIAVRAHRQLGRPAPRPFVREHWRLGQLYKNPDDPALFVPTRRRR